jgi:hypothetical protein
LLLNDVRSLASRSLKKPQIFKGWGANFAVTVTGTTLPEGFLNQPPFSDVVWQNVLCASRGFELDSHFAESPRSL